MRWKVVFLELAKLSLALKEVAVSRVEAGLAPVLLLGGLVAHGLELLSLGAEAADLEFGLDGFRGFGGLGRAGGGGVEVIWNGVRGDVGHDLMLSRSGNRGTGRPVYWLALCAAQAPQMMAIGWRPARAQPRVGMPSAM